METIAIYREDIIKTYGFAERTGLSLASIDLPLEEMANWGAAVMDGFARSGVGVVLMMAQPEGDETLRLILVMDRLPEIDFRRFGLAESFPGEGRIYPSVDMISFQGPHYGDRYGIASAALEALGAHHIPILALICSGASVYLITHQGIASQAVQALQKAFTVPERRKGPQE